jgi:hypothetical protein
MNDFKGEAASMIRAYSGAKKFIAIELEYL